MGEIRAAGGNLVAISPQQEQFSKEMVEQHKLDFGLLSDRGNAVARQFGLVFPLSPPLRAAYAKFGIDLAKFNGDDSWTLPLPGSYVIDRGGTIRYANVDPDHTARPEPEEIVKALRAAAR
jgi:peroxiredoxin